MVSVQANARAGSLLLHYDPALLPWQQAENRLAAVAWAAVAPQDAQTPKASEAPKAPKAPISSGVCSVATVDAGSFTANW